LFGSKPFGPPKPAMRSPTDMKRNPSRSNAMPSDLLDGLKVGLGDGGHAGFDALHANLG
jgi:hypothetical protein